MKNDATIEVVDLTGRIIHTQSVSEGFSTYKVSLGDYPAGTYLVWVRYNNYRKDVERVLYYESYIVIDGGMTEMERGQLLTEEEYYESVASYGDDFTEMMGGEAIRKMLETTMLDEEIAEIRELVPLPLL